jgi:hypothetical protein
MRACVLLLYAKKDNAVSFTDLTDLQHASFTQHSIEVHRCLHRLNAVLTEQYHSCALCLLPNTADHTARYIRLLEGVHEGANFRIVRTRPNHSTMLLSTVATVVVVDAITDSRKSALAHVVDTTRLSASYTYTYICMHVCYSCGSVLPRSAPPGPSRQRRSVQTASCVEGSANFCLSLTVYRNIHNCAVDSAAPLVTVVPAAVQAAVCALVSLLEQTVAV